MLSNTITFSTNLNRRVVNYMMISVTLKSLKKLSSFFYTFQLTRRLRGFNLGHYFPNLA